MWARARACMDAPNAADGSIPADIPMHGSVPADGFMSTDMSGDGDATLDAVLRLQRHWRGQFVRSEATLGTAFWNIVAEAISVSSDSVPTTSKQPSGKRGTSQRDVKAIRAAGKGSGMRSWRIAARQSLFTKTQKQPHRRNSLSQGWSDNGDLAIARMVDNVMLAPLVYRLVALNPSKAWGAGKLVQLAEKPTSDEELAQELSALLLRPWEDDPTRAYELKEEGFVDTYSGWNTRVRRLPSGSGLLAASTSSTAGRDASGNMDPDGETWGDVLLEGRGNVGETVLHLAFLLNTPASRRLVRFLVPYLANEKTTDLFGHKVAKPQT